MEPARVKYADDDARSAAEDDVRVTVVSAEPSPTHDKKLSLFEDAFGVELDCRKIAIAFAVLAIAATGAGVIAYIVSTGELSGRRPGSRLSD